MSDKSIELPEAARARIAGKGAKLAATARRMATSAARVRIEAAQIAALHYAAETLKDAFGEAESEPD